ncbi:hypothetical protein QZH41_006272 [Actinostola sp. cb2023]|nr:hypothetical protein QZH41_006272 [Actinostola sp. cb2023]
MSSLNGLSKKQHVHVEKHSVFREIETLLDEKIIQKRAQESRSIPTTVATVPPLTIPTVPSDNSNYNLEYMEVGNVQNADVIRRSHGGFCSIPFDYGDMCPQSYTEVGGYCEFSRDEKGFECPDMRTMGALETRQCQLITTRMLRIFDLIARKNKIRYWLYGGTLLGAARHKGNIPWDTDNDIQMPLDDYVRFFTIVSKQLPKDIFFQNSESDPALRPSNYRKKKNKIYGIYQANYNPRLRDRSSCYKYCLKHGCGWHDGMMIDIFVHDGNLDGIFPLQEMEFEGFKFPVSSNWQSMLVNKYGKNYMNLPKTAKQRRPVDFPDPLLSCDEIKLTLEQQSRFE